MPAFLFSRVTDQVTVAPAGRLAGFHVAPLSVDWNRWKRAPCFLIFVRDASLNFVTALSVPLVCRSPGPGRESRRPKKGCPHRAVRSRWPERFDMSLPCNFSSEAIARDHGWGGSAANRSRLRLSSLRELASTFLSVGRAVNSGDVSISCSALPKRPAA